MDTDSVFGCKCRITILYWNEFFHIFEGFVKFIFPTDISHLSWSSAWGELANGNLSAKHCGQNHTVWPLNVVQEAYRFYCVTVWLSSNPHRVRDLDEYDTLTKYKSYFSTLTDTDKDLSWIGQFGQMH